MNRPFLVSLVPEDIPEPSIKREDIVGQNFPSDGAQVSSVIFEASRGDCDIRHGLEKRAPQLITFLSWPAPKVKRRSAG